jgi:hypothetical protein
MRFEEKKSVRNEFFSKERAPFFRYVNRRGFICPPVTGQGPRAYENANRGEVLSMIHGLPAETAAAASYGARAGVRSAQDGAEHPEHSGSGANRAPADAAAGSARRLAPPDPLDSKEGIKEERPGTGRAKAPSGQGLSEAEQAELEELEARDQEVRAHEQAHMAAGSRYITRGAQYTFEQGPDGVRYAVGGDVQVDFSPVPGDPEATIEKARAVYKAALAPAQPSAQDRRVAAQAMQMKMQAQAEQIQMETQKKPEVQGPTEEKASDPEAVFSPDSAAGARGRVDVRA